MRMLDDCIRMRLWVKVKADSPDLVSPDGTKLAGKRDMNEDDVFFQVMEVGPQVKEEGVVEVGNIITVSFMSQDMFRMKHPDEEDKTFICRRPAVLGILYKQAPIAVRQLQGE